ncbi:MAG: glycosyltransferase [Pseudomonadota bacterium]
MKIYYSINDPYPAYRVDLTELFGVELQRLGVETKWFMDAPLKKGVPPNEFFGQQVVVPEGGAGLLRKGRYWFFDISRIASLKRSDVDAIQCRDKYIGALAGLLKARALGIPFFYWCSYPFPEHKLALAEKATGGRKLLSLAQGWLGYWILYKIVMPNSTHVFVQSEQMKRDLTRIGVDPSKMTPVLMGVASGMLDWARRNEVSVEPEKVVYLGTFASVRRLGTVIRAFSQVVKNIPKAKLFMVGDGDVPEERAELERLAKELDISESVVFTGFVPMEQAWLHAKSAAVCLSPFYPTPILASASPTKLVEYMALGRPIICNDHPEQSSVIQDSGAGICVQWNEKDFADAITWVLQNRGEAERRANFGPDWVQNNRVYKKIAEQVYEIYKSKIKVGG